MNNDLRMRGMNGARAASRGPRCAAFVAVLALALLGGCATNNPRDPLEPMNRAIYGFNDTFDRAIAKPVAQGYHDVVPEFARDVVTNFFSNLDDVWVMVNNLLQGKPRAAADDFGRVVINSSVGLLGAFDIASEAGLQKHNEDFGQTLGYWGVHSGPYLVLPFVGPSTLRDASAWWLVDTQGDLVRHIHNVPTRNELLLLRLVNTRANLLDVTNLLDQAALDPYTFMRDAYLQRRESLVHDGAVQPDKDRDQDQGNDKAGNGKSSSAADHADGAQAAADATASASAEQATQEQAVEGQVVENHAASETAQPAGSHQAQAAAQETPASQAAAAVPTDVTPTQPAQQGASLEPQQTLAAQPTAAQTALLSESVTPVRGHP